VDHSWRPHLKNNTSNASGVTFYVLCVDDGRRFVVVVDILCGSHDVNIYCELC